MRAARRPTPAEITTIEIVRDAQVALTLRAIANDLDEDAEEIERLVGGDRISPRIRERRAQVLALLGKGTEA